MPWPNQFWPNQFWPNQVKALGPNPGFNCTLFRNFPTMGVPGDLWYTTDTQDLYIAVLGPNQYFQGQSARANVTRVWELGLNVVVTMHAGVPKSGPAGTIYLTTDTFQAFADTGVSVIRFRLDVRRALRGAPVSSQVGKIGGAVQAVSLVPLAS